MSATVEKERSSAAAVQAQDARRVGANIASVAEQQNMPAHATSQADLAIVEEGSLNLHRPDGTSRIVSSAAASEAALREAAVALAAETDSPTDAFDYAYSRRIACLSDPASAAAASYRSLQTHLLAGHVRDGRRGLALCAPRRETGCTTIAVNLAVAFAQAGINTLLVDANLHRPAVHDFIRPSSPAGGLAQMLAAGPDRRIDEVRRQVRPNLSILYAGGAPAKAHDLIANRWFKQIIDDCMRSYEFTIVDTPALCDGTDARHIAMSVRYGMVIARRGATLVAEVHDAVDELSSDRVRLIGSFLADL